MSSILPWALNQIKNFIIWNVFIGKNDTFYLFFKLTNYSFKWVFFFISVIIQLFKQFSICIVHSIWIVEYNILLQYTYLFNNGTYRGQAGGGWVESPSAMKSRLFQTPCFSEGLNWISIKTLKKKYFFLILSHTMAEGGGSELKQGTICPLKGTLCKISIFCGEVRGSPGVRKSYFKWKLDTFNIISIFPTCSAFDIASAGYSIVTILRHFLLLLPKHV